MTVSNKDAALDFLRLVTAGEIDRAYGTYVAADMRHHNAWFAAGADALREAMKAAHMQQPGKVFEVQQAIADGDRVAVHSRLCLKPADPGYATVHIFRFEAGRIAEMWDVAMEVPASTPNTDGAF